MAKKRVTHRQELRIGGNTEPFSGGPFVKIANIRTFARPGHSNDAVDLTCLDSEIDEARKAPQKTLGDITIEILWDDEDANHLALQVAADADYPNEIFGWQFYLPYTSGSEITYTGAGWVKDLSEVSYTVKGEVVRNLTIHLTEKLVKATAS